MIAPRLVDDGSSIKGGGREVAGGADDLDAPFMRPVIRPRA